jgi:hypothetical protein
MGHALPHALSVFARPWRASQAGPLTAAERPFPAARAPWLAAASAAHSCARHASSHPGAMLHAAIHAGRARLVLTHGSQGTATPSTPPQQALPAAIPSAPCLYLGSRPQAAGPTKLSAPLTACARPAAAHTPRRPTAPRPGGARGTARAPRCAAPRPAAPAQRGNTRAVPGEPRGPLSQGNTRTVTSTAKHRRSSRPAA